MPPRALVLSFDRLHIGYLGCYGNEWIETPHFDRLAAEAVTFDRHFAENVDPQARTHAWWTGRYQLAEGAREQPAFVEHLSVQGVKSWLFAESDGHDSAQIAPPFDEIVEVRGEDSLEAAEDRTPFARLVQRACEGLPAIAADKAPTLIWLKSRGVPDPWLPPREFADLYLDEFGLENAGEEHGGNGASQSAATEPHDPYDEPEEVWQAESGQSVDLKYARALYAAYVTHLDRWVGKLRQALARVAGDDWLLIVTAAAGQPLGEHGELEVPADLLREEVIHVPLWIRVPDPAHAGSRRAALVQTVDIAPTLLDWFAAASPPLCKGGPGGVEASKEAVAESQSPKVAKFTEEDCHHGHSLLPLVRLETDRIRDAVVVANAEEWGLRTDDFFLVQRRNAPAPEEGHEAIRLFEKPNDRWDQADMSSQYPQVVEDLYARLMGWMVP